MTVDVTAAEAFVYANARLLDRRRTEVLLHGAPAGRVVDALRAYANDDGGFGSALEPDVRGPNSEPAAALHALEVLAGVGALDDPMVSGLAKWVAGVAEADGGVPFVLPATAQYPHAPWMVPSDGGSHLTFGLAAILGQARVSSPWVERGTAWCWRILEGPEPLGGYLLKFALDFLDATPDAARAEAVIDRLRPLIRADGSVPVAGGTEDEKLLPLTLAPRPGARSRALFTPDQIDADLERLERDQQQDGGWVFDWLAWSPGQSAEWRGLLTLRALALLQAHDRLG
jgi:hypothetical protein